MNGWPPNATWLPITCAPKDKPIWSCRPGDMKAFILVWKHNPRIATWHAEGAFLNYMTDYFGVPDELDDYNFALPEEQPTLWHQLLAPPPLGVTP